MDAFFSSSDYVSASLRNLMVDVNCGLHPWERFPERPTRLCLNIEVFAPLAAGRMEPQGYIDYARIRRFTKTLSEMPHVDLLESIIDMIVELCFEDSRVEACRVSAMKPDIFNEAGGAGVEAFRTRTSWLQKP